MDNFKNKYMEYKFKYLNLKHSQNGGGKNHDMTLKKIWFDFIKNNKKTIECRIYDEKRKQIKVGDTITFINDDEKITKKVVRLEIFSPPQIFENVINSENYKLLIPNAQNIDDAIKVYNDIPSYSDKAQKFGIILIHI